MAKKNRRYDDEDEISRSIAEFQGAGDVQPEGTMTVDDKATVGEDEDEALEPFGIMGKKDGIVGKFVDGDRFDEESGGRGDDMDTIDEDAKKVPRVFKDARIPECSCCGAKWSVTAEGTIRNGCGCRIHPTCDQCEKCKGHCVCQIQQVKQINS